MSIAVSALSSTMSAEDRVRRRLRALVDERRLPQHKIADRLKKARSAVNRLIHGPTPVTVRFLEAVQEETGIPITELIAEPGTVHELNADEAALIRWLRRWPVTVTRSLCAFLAFFADEASDVRQTRNMNELWRRMGAKDRDWLYGVTLLVRERTITAEMKLQILRNLEVEALSAHEARFPDEPSTPLLAPEEAASWLVRAASPQLPRSSRATSPAKPAAGGETPGKIRGPRGADPKAMKKDQPKK